jgi:hypothetical protein
MSKLIDELGKYYENAGKQRFKTNQSYGAVKAG